MPIASYCSSCSCRINHAMVSTFTPTFCLYFLPSFITTPPLSFPPHWIFQYLIFNLTFWVCLSVRASTILYTTHFHLPLHQSKFLFLFLSDPLPSKNYPFSLHAMLFAIEVRLLIYTPTNSLFFLFSVPFTHPHSSILPHENSLLFACSPIHIPYPFNPFPMSVEAVGGSACDIFFTGLSPLKYSPTILSWSFFSCVSVH